MTSNMHATNRCVLKPSVSQVDVAKFATSLNWQRVSDIPAGPERTMGRQVTWRATEFLALHYIEDAIASWAYFLVSGIDKNAIEGVASVARDHLDHWSTEELIERARTEETLSERARLIIAVGLAAPQEFNDSTFRLIEVSMRDPERGIRYAALWAAAYAEYPELIPAITDVARNDSIQAHQRRAQSILDAFGEAERLCVMNRGTGASYDNRV